MSKLVEPKIYQGKDLETIFFRPMFVGGDARDLGIKVMYNMPVPTTLNFWRGSGDILKGYAPGWTGGKGSDKFQKTIEMHKVKAEMGYSAADYFTMVFEQITNRPEVNMDDLSGTELEEAETALFRDALAESIRATMWIGDTKRTSKKFSTFDGLLTRLSTEILGGGTTEIASKPITQTEYDAADSGEAILKKAWNQADVKLKELKSQGQLVFYVTSDVYSKYEESLDNASLDTAYVARQTGRPQLLWRGIPVVDMQVSGYMSSLADTTMPKTWVMLTDRRNIALAVNTSDFPGTEIRMWYNADEMQNRQRAVFAVGCDYLLPEFMSVLLKM